MHEGSYAGRELALFARAIRWKSYFSYLIIPYLHGSVLEVGAGTGNTTPFLNRSGAIALWTLLEPDADFCAQLQRDIEAGTLPGNCTVINGDLQALSSESHYDVILYIDVLEHIECDNEELTNAAKKLHPGGVIVVLSPAHAWLYSRFDRALGHFRRYNKKSLTCAAAATGLKLVELRYLDAAGSLLSLANRLLLRQSYPNARQIATWDRIFIPVSLLLDRLLCYTFGKSILAIWKKPDSMQ